MCTTKLCFDENTALRRITKEERNNIYDYITSLDYCASLETLNGALNLSCHNIAEEDYEKLRQAFPDIVEP